MAEKKFDPRLASVLDFMGTLGQSFYLPSYQRDEVWESGQVERMVEDILFGIDRLVRGDSDAATFIGTLIFFDDREYKTINPIVKNEVPSAVFDVIDGQQRLTALMLISISLHDLLSGLQKDATTPFLKKQLDDCLGSLPFIYEEKQLPHSEEVFYPRMIRAHQDQWSHDENRRQYESPIGALLHKYGEHTRKSGKGSRFSIGKDETDPHKKEFSKLFKFTSKIIKNICKEGQHEEAHLPDLKSIIKGRKDVNQFLSWADNNGQDKIDINNDKHKTIFRAALLVRYLLYRVKFISVVVDDEDYAFDVFESLNTTGVVLTAFETFRPEMIKTEGLTKWEKSISKKHADAVDDFLRAREGVNEKQRVTAELLISFALAETGDKISKHFREQRTYMRQMYGKDEDTERQRSFSKHLMHVSDFTRKVVGEIDLDCMCNDKELADHARLCLHFLRDMKHTISYPLLSRFYSAMCLAKSPVEKQDRCKEMCEAIRATAAFFCLWMASKPNTEGIDSRYRNLMAKGLGEGKDRIIDAACREKARGIISVDALKEAFRYLLEKDGGNYSKTIADKDGWLRYVSKESPRRDVARLLLMAASNDSVSDGSGVLVNGRPGTLPLLNLDCWKSKGFETIEHIFPTKAEKPGWDDSLFGEKEILINTLGNYTLLPVIENVVSSNKDWEKKRAIYRIISERKVSEFNKLLDEAENNKLIKAKEINSLKARGAGFLPLPQSISEVDNFDADYLKKRGKNLAERAWDVLAVKWLDWK